MRGKHTMAFYLNPYSVTLDIGQILEVIVERTRLSGRCRSDSSIYGNSCSLGNIRRGRYITWES